MKAFLGSFLSTTLIASLFCGALLFAQTATADEDPSMTVGSCKSSKPLGVHTCTTISCPGTQTCKPKSTSGGGGTTWCECQ
jgi:hypothetical protein